VKLDLIGSFARGEQTEDSDIDLLVEFEPDTDDLFGKKTKLKDLLKVSFDREVDICREKYRKPYIMSYLLKEVIYV
jgi:predicted nucleotidyltransferase